MPALAPRSKIPARGKVPAGSIGAALCRAETDLPRPRVDCTGMVSSSPVCFSDGIPDTRSMMLLCRPIFFWVAVLLIIWAAYALILAKPA